MADVLDSKDSFVKKRKTIKKISCQCLYIYGMHTYSLQSHAHPQTHTHRSFCPPPRPLPCSALKGSTLLNCIPQPIDYFNGVLCYMVGFSVPTPPQNHTVFREGNRSHTFFLSGSLCARQSLNIAIVRLQFICLSFL